MKRILVVLAVIGIVGEIAFAAPITYSEMTTASGTIGGTTFTNALVTVSLIGNTSNVTSAPAPLNQFLENPGTATINIAGVGTATFTDLVEILSTFNSPSPSPFNGQPTVLIATLDNPQGTSVTGVVFATNPAFFGYDLGTSIGPISGLGGDASGPDGVHHTTMGDLFFANDIGQAGTATFTASTVPEPTSLTLFSFGLLGLTSLCLRRNRA